MRRSALIKETRVRGCGRHASPRHPTHRTQTLHQRCARTHPHTQCFPLLCISGHSALSDNDAKLAPRSAWWAERAGEITSWARLSVVLDANASTASNASFMDGSTGRRKDIKIIFYTDGTVECVSINGARQYRSSLVRGTRDARML